MDVLETGLGEIYRRVGAVDQRPDVWLVRHLNTQKLAILQRFDRPFPALAEALNSRSLPGFPKVLESWVDRGQIMVLLERVEERPGALSLGLSRRLRQQLDVIRQAVRRLHFGELRLGDLCLNREGQLQLRWIPGEYGPVRPLKSPRRPWFGWLWGRTAAC